MENFLKNKQLLYAMDTSFSLTGPYSMQTRCEMLAEAGYSGAYITSSRSPARWKEIEELHKVAMLLGLRVDGINAAVWMSGDMATESLAEYRRLMELVPPKSNLELQLVGDPKLTPVDGVSDQAPDIIRELLAASEKAQHSLALYLHFGSRVETVAQAVALCRHVQHPRLKMVFCGFHWFVCKEKDLVADLRAALPFLCAVNLCGVSKGGNINGYAIQELGQGHMDNFAVLGLLKDAGFQGPVGIQGYSVAGDPFIALKRSHDAFREMEDRLERHPSWRVAS